MTLSFKGFYILITWIFKYGHDFKKLKQPSKEQTWPNIEPREVREPEIWSKDVIHINRLEVKVLTPQSKKKSDWMMNKNADFVAKLSRGRLHLGIPSVMGRIPLMGIPPVPPIWFPQVPSLHTQIPGDLSTLLEFASIRETPKTLVIYASANSDLMAKTRGFSKSSSFYLSCCPWCKNTKKRKKT